jgi:hypothetical protein
MGLDIEMDGPPPSRSRSSSIVVHLSCVCGFLWGLKVEYHGRSHTAYWMHLTLFSSTFQPIQ